MANAGTLPILETCMQCGGTIKVTCASCSIAHQPLTPRAIRPALYAPGTAELASSLLPLQVSFLPL